MSASRILLVDDDVAFRSRVREALGGTYLLEEAGSQEEFWLKFKPYEFDILIVDMRLRHGKEGLDILTDVFIRDELQPAIMVSAYGDTESAIEAVGRGAMMFLHKQEFTPGLLGRMVEAVMEQGRLRRQVRNLRKLAWSGDPDGLLGTSDGIRSAADALRLAPHSAERMALITGERGSGTSLAARLIHRGSDRSDGPFVEVNAPEPHQINHFLNDRTRLCSQGNGGTFAIDGVEAISDEIGRQLLARIDSERGGSNSARAIFIMHESGADQSLSKSSALAWLFERNPLQLRIPPLRERKDDIPILAAHFLQLNRTRGNTKTRGIASAAMDYLEKYPWPGNVRELRNTVEYAAIQAAGDHSDEVSAGHLPANLRAEGASAMLRRPQNSVATVWDYRLHLARTELGLADRAIREQGIGQKTKLAKVLGYTDRLILARRISKALREFPSLSSEFLAVTKLFHKPH